MPDVVTCTSTQLQLTNIECTYIRTGHDSQGPCVAVQAAAGHPSDVAHQLSLYLQENP